MAITAMGTVRNINRSCLTKFAIILLLACSSFITLAGDWKFIPSLSLDETYSDNVNLSVSEPTSSYVTQAKATINATYRSGLTNLNWSGTQSYALYSHDSSLNTNYRSLAADGLYSMWVGGPDVIASANIQNVNKNNADNDLSDPITGDTVQTQNYSTGLRYNFGNSSYSVQSSITYSTNRAEDSIGESDGIAAQLSSVNGNSTRYIYWNMGINYSKREQELDNNIDNYGENYSVNALIGAKTPWKLRPFVRFQDEYVKGTGISEDFQFNPSWGVGLSWFPTPRFNFDVSYNVFANSDTDTDTDNSDNNNNNNNNDYIAASLRWQPSLRTSLTADYSQRFFGKAYSFNFQHKIRRLSNSITYNETLSVFDRNNYQLVPLGMFWCPRNTVIEDASSCFVTSETPPDSQFIALFNLAPVDSNEFSLNKILSWSTILQLSRTSFAFDTSASRRERLGETATIDDSFNVGLNITRDTGARTNVSLGMNFRHNIFDKSNTEVRGQEDYYRTISANYNISMASSLTSDFTLRHVNRSSTNDQFGYKEIRATINIRKVF